MSRCSICGTAVPEGRCEHVTPYHHIVDGHKYWSNVTGGGDMHCTNCGYKMRFVGGKWACDACTNTQPEPDPCHESYEAPDAMDNADSLTVVCQVGRFQHGNAYTEEFTDLTDEQEHYLNLWDLTIKDTLDAYRKDTLSLTSYQEH